jgi:hypothetical protein
MPSRGSLKKTKKRKARERVDAGSDDPVTPVIQRRRLPNFDSDSEHEAELKELDEKALLGKLYMEQRRTTRVLMHLVREMGTFIASTPKKQSMVTYPVWSSLCRDKVLAWYTTNLQSQRGVQFIFNGSREVASRALERRVSEELGLDGHGKRVQLVGKAKSVHAYLNSYIHNFCHRTLGAMMNALMDCTVLRALMLNGSVDLAGQDVQEEKVL